MKEVRVKWIDSCSGNCSWDFLKDFKPSICKPTTYGFVIYEDDEKLSIAQTFAEEDNDAPTQINGVITIPKCAILKMEILIQS